MVISRIWAAAPAAVALRHAPLALALDRARGARRRPRCRGRRVPPRGVYYSCVHFGQPPWAPGEPGIPRPGLVLTVATVLYAGVWPVAFALPDSGPDHDPHAGIALAGTATIFYWMLLLTIGTQIFANWLDKRPRGGYRGGQRLAGAVRHPRACYQPARQAASAGR